MHPPQPVSSYLDVLLLFLNAIADAIADTIAMIDVEAFVRWISHAVARSWHFILWLPGFLWHSLEIAGLWIEDCLLLIGRILLLLCLWLAIVFATWTVLFIATHLICFLAQTIKQFHRRSRAERQPLLRTHHHPVRYPRLQRVVPISDHNDRAVTTEPRRQPPTYMDYRNHESRRNHGFAPQTRPLATMTEAQLLQHQTVMNWLLEPPVTIRGDARIGFSNSRQARLSSYGTMPLLPPPPYQSVVPPPPSYSSQPPPPPPYC